jgi:hypothetical protein
MEEGASFHSTGNVWRGFLATSVGVLTVQTLFQVRALRASVRKRYVHAHDVAQGA